MNPLSLRIPNGLELYDHATSEQGRNYMLFWTWDGDERVEILLQGHSFALWEFAHAIMKAVDKDLTASLESYPENDPRHELRHLLPPT